MRGNIDFERLYQEYQSIVEYADRFGSVVYNELLRGIEDAKIQLGFPIQKRVKQWESIKEKYQRIPRDVENITDLQDLVGLRLILLFSRDTLKVGAIIGKLFNVVRKYDSKDRLKSDQFGYSSMHYVIELSKDKLVTHELQFPKKLKAEIQVRTIVQHLWAEASHTLQYKQEASIPNDVSRSIHRVSAILETVDLEFEKVLAKRDEYRYGIVNLDTDAPLNVDLLEITLNHLWPCANKKDIENYDYLLGLLKYNNITTQIQLVEIIRKHRDEVLKRSAREAEYLRNIIHTYPLENGKITIRSENRVVTHSGITPELIASLEKGIFYGHVAMTVTALQFETGERTPLEPLE
jgi:ppGpp synthetase/RelA/SpoT-type nucleotidyltranferase